jgi:hypothetical protein
MSKKDTSGPAFPVPDERDAQGNGICQGSPGMSLREYYAGQALAGLAQSLPPELVLEIAAGIRGGYPFALAAVALADATLKALGKE